MTDLAVEYNDRRPDFFTDGKRTDIWVVDDSNLVVRWHFEDKSGEEWSRLFKEEDVENMLLICKTLGRKYNAEG